MTYGHLQADCLYIEISSGPNARCRVWEAFTFTFLLVLVLESVVLVPVAKKVLVAKKKYFYCTCSGVHESTVKQLASVNSVNTTIDIWSDRWTQAYT